MLNNLTMQKDVLLKIVKNNRVCHKIEYEEAFEHYRILQLAKIKESVEKFKDEPCAKNLPERLQMPVEHLDDYDEVISALEHMENNSVELSENQYRQYVLDKWTFSESFKNINSTYIAGHTSDFKW